LENAGVFNFPLGGDSGDLLFFSRQIGIDPITGEEVPINGGAKVTGSIRNFELGVMDVDTRSSGPNPYANYAVARLKRSLWGGSYIGVMGIDKRSGNPFDSFIFHAPDTHHVLQTQEWQNTFRIEFNNGSYSDDDIVDVFTQRLITPFNIYKNIFIPVGEYHWTRHQLTYGSPQDRRLMVS